MAIKKVFVLGAGTMGNGIAQVTASSGFDVVMMDVKQEFLTRAMDTITKSMDRMIKKGTIKEEDKAKTLGHIKTTLDIKDAKDADLVIECAPEILELKTNLFKQLDEICKPEAILATNTSALPISSFAGCLKNPARVLGIHFMNPVPVIKGVEVIPSQKTSPAVLEASKEFIKSIGKEPCEARDYAGFIVSRLVDALMNEAIHCVMDGNKPEEIDKAMRLCCNFPIGPLELCDLAGAEIVLHGLETMHKEFGDRLLPAPLLKDKVRSGYLGRKTNRGFYEYPQK